ncbi:MAG: cytochrome P450 [Candidatus Promineifilaceae bacterium]
MTQSTQPNQLYNPATYTNGVPYALLNTLRQEKGIVWIEEPALGNYPAGSGFWFVLRHNDIQNVMRNAKQFSSWVGGTQVRDPGSAEDLSYVRRMMLNMDPPEHSRLRRLLHKTFTPSAIAKIEAGIQVNAKAIVDRVVGDAANGGSCDFAKDIAADLPLLTLADVLGVPREDRMLLFDWANRVIGFLDPDYAVSDRFDPATGSEIARQVMAFRPKPDQNGIMPDPRSRAGMLDLYTYAHLLAEEKRRNPSDDVMSLLLNQIDDEDGRVSIEEFENLFWLFAVAGNETLRNGIPGGMIALLQHPDSMEAIQNDPSKLETAVDEMLRWWTPVMLFRRTATADCNIAGQKVRAGDKIVVSFSSGNRDDAVFDNPEQFDILRSPNPHLSFGYGPHYCIGAHLARAQMRAIFSQVLTRMGTISLNGEIVYLQSNFQRGVKKLPIRYTNLTSPEEPRSDLLPFGRD